MDSGLAPTPVQTGYLPLVVGEVLAEEREGFDSGAASEDDLGRPPDTASLSVENEGDVVEVAVAPVLARFGGAHDGVAGIAGVGGGVPVG